MERMDFSLGASIVDLRSYDRSLLKQCRSVSELDDHTAMDGTNSRKLSRTDSYLSCRQQQSNDSSMSPDENPISQLGSNSNDQHLIMSSPGGYLNQVSAAAMRQLLPYQQQQQYSFRQTQGQSFGTLAQQYNPFTAPQWAELEQQALIFKYMMARVRVPPELLNPIRSSVAAATIGPHNLIPSCSIGGSWGGFQLGVSSSPLDVEPGRCRRTDGKKWRCSRPVVPEQKYCERHIHRGRDRSKKAQEAAAAAAAQSRNGVGTGAGLLKSTTSTRTSNPAFQSTMKGNFNGGGVSIGGKMFASSSMPGMVEAGGELSHSQLPSTLSASQSNKDQRFLNAMSKAHPEQLVFSEVSGSTREPMQGHPSHLSKLSSATTSMIPTTAKNSSMQQHFGNQLAMQQQYKSMMGYVSGPSSMKSLQELTTLAPERYQQQHGVSSPLIRGIERKAEALRHFFDDWPRASMAQSSALSWSDTDDSHAKLNSSWTTQLSGPRNSSEYDETTANARAESAMFSPLKLGLEDTTNSGVGLSEEEDGADPYTSMGLPNVRDRAPWFGNANLGDASGSNPTSGGGPLTVALQNPSNAKIGFNLLGGGRNLVASPTGVLQFSDCSSSASSPGSVKTEANNPH